MITTNPTKTRGWTHVLRKGLAIPALLMTPVVLLLDMGILLDTSLRKQVQIT
jgi:hypothetical protein